MERNTCCHVTSIFVQRLNARTLFDLQCLCCSHFLGLFVSADVRTEDADSELFSSAEDASRALFNANEGRRPTSFIEHPRDQPERRVLSSGDREEDLDARVSFVVKYQENASPRHRGERNCKPDGGRRNTGRFRFRS